MLYAVVVRGKGEDDGSLSAHRILAFSDDMARAIAYTKHGKENIVMLGPEHEVAKMFSAQNAAGIGGE